MLSVGPVMQMCTDRRGVYVRTEYLSPTRAMLTFNLPLAEVIYDMHDKLKSVTRGYGTMDYELIGYFPAELVRLDILVGGNRVDALSIICDRRDAERPGRRTSEDRSQKTGSERRPRALTSPAPSAFRIGLCRAMH